MSWITTDDAVIIWPNLLFSMLKNDLSCAHVTCTQRASLFDELGGLKRLVFTIKPCREVRVRCAPEDASVSSRSHYALLRQTNRQQKGKGASKQSLRRCLHLKYMSRAGFLPLSPPFQPSPTLLLLLTRRRVWGRLSGYLPLCW